MCFSKSLSVGRGMNCWAVSIKDEGKLLLVHLSNNEEFNYTDSKTAVYIKEFAWF